jgi:hypothetical protein
MKRRSTIEAHSLAVTAPSKIIGRAVIIPSRAPANDTGERSAAMLELIDDLAALAAKLYHSGRLSPGKISERDEDR